MLCKKVGDKKKLISSTKVKWKFMETVAKAKNNCLDKKALCVSKQRLVRKLLIAQVVERDPRVRISNPAKVHH